MYEPRLIVVCVCFCMFDLWKSLEKIDQVKNEGKDSKFFPAFSPPPRPKITAPAVTVRQSCIVPAACLRRQRRVSPPPRKHLAAPAATSFRARGHVLPLLRSLLSPLRFPFSQVRLVPGITYG